MQETHLLGMRETEERRLAANRRPKRSQKICCGKDFLLWSIHMLQERRKGFKQRWFVACQQMPIVL